MGVKYYGNNRKDWYVVTALTKHIWLILLLGYQCDLSFLWHFAFLNCAAIRAIAVHCGALMEINVSDFGEITKCLCNYFLKSQFVKGSKNSTWNLQLKTSYQSHTICSLMKNIITSVVKNYSLIGFTNETAVTFGTIMARLVK